MNAFFLWHKAIFVVDANILLHVYEFALNESEELVKNLTHLRRLWIPHQFYDEYCNNQSKVRQRMIDRQYTVGKDSEVIIRDRLAYEMTQLFSIGQPYSESRKEDLFIQAEHRYAQKIRPGYNDKGKFEPYGDVLGWFQIIDYAKEKKLPVIMVTDDSNWFEKDGRFKRTPPELVKEMHDKAGVEFRLYTCEQFINFARHYQRPQELVKPFGEFFRRLNYPKFSPDLGKSAMFSSLPAMQPISERFAALTAMQPIGGGLSPLTAMNSDFKNIGLFTQKQYNPLTWPVIDGARPFDQLDIVKKIADLHTPIPINRRFDEILNKPYMQTEFLDTIGHNSFRDIVSDTFMPEMARRNMESFIARDVVLGRKLSRWMMELEQDAQNPVMLAIDSALGSHNPMKSIEAVLALYPPKPLSDVVQDIQDSLALLGLHNPPKSISDMLADVDTHIERMREQAGSAPKLSSQISPTNDDEGDVADDNGDDDST